MYNHLKLIPKKTQHAVKKDINFTDYRKFTNQEGDVNNDFLYINQAQMVDRYQLDKFFPNEELINVNRSQQVYPSPSLKKIDAEMQQNGQFTPFVDNDFSQSNFMPSKSPDGSMLIHQNESMLSSK